MKTVAHVGGRVPGHWMPVVSEEPSRGQGHGVGQRTGLGQTERVVDDAPPVGCAQGLPKESEKSKKKHKQTVQRLAMERNRSRSHSSVYRNVVVESLGQRLPVVGRVVDAEETVLAGVQFDPRSAGQRNAHCSP